MSEVSDLAILVVSHTAMPDKYDSRAYFEQKSSFFLGDISCIPEPAFPALANCV